ncbi:MAG: aminotransferase class I/II-fold pyridoxal phosphate-dependent enzyme [Candidatus Micrarchaeota archaeon]|nr:aminotransferase class I/II-fold pyridoxal phosphate-dependent enzyme [Candidatus Micrarchaeota archaeon]MDE1864407.1 aminotransferase class I/II-fold pyridoxal phosphate-dependent enzyme [Candidatus Micrarchaeota archaeon]
MVLSKRSKYAFNPIDEDNELAAKIMKSGKKVMQLNRGDIAIYFPTPKYIKDAYIEAIRENKMGYTQSRGIPELIDAVIERYKRMFRIGLSEEDIVITEGVSEALYFLNASMLNPGNHAVVFKPYYTQYIPNIELSEGKAYHLDYDEKRGWDIDTDELDRHMKKMKERRGIKYIMITNPNNPTGTVLGRRTLEEVVELAKNHGLALVSDEIYDEIVFNGAKFTSVSQLAKGVPHVILNGASKNLDATGFRIGYMIVPGEDKESMELKRKFEDFATVRVSVNAPAQYAVAEAIRNVKEHKRAIGYMVGEIENRVNYAMKLLGENPYLTTVKPHGAYYIFPRIDLKSLNYKKDKEFVDDLLEKTLVQFTRGSGFGAQSHFRIVALPEKKVLGEAINRMNDFCRKRAR